MDDINSIKLSKPCVIVHYRAWTESTCHKFEDTREEQRPLELVLGKGKRIYDPFFILKSIQNLHRAFYVVRGLVVVFPHFNFVCSFLSELFYKCSFHSLLLSIPQWEVHHI